MNDAVCRHGVAFDVHCCNCHSGFFPPDDCHCRWMHPWWSRALCRFGSHDWLDGPGSDCRVCGKPDELFEDLKP